MTHDELIALAKEAGFTPAQLRNEATMASIKRLADLLEDAALVGVLAGLSGHYAQGLKDGYQLASVQAAWPSRSPWSRLHGTAKTLVNECAHVVLGQKPRGSAE